VQRNCEPAPEGRGNLRKSGLEKETYTASNANIMTPTDLVVVEFHRSSFRAAYKNIDSSTFRRVEALRLF